VRRFPHERVPATRRRCPPAHGGAGARTVFNVDGEALAADYLCQLYRMDELLSDADEYDTVA
jgi:hypothetical protein